MSISDIEKRVAAAAALAAKRRAEREAAAGAMAIPSTMAERVALYRKLADSPEFAPDPELIEKFRPLSSVQRVGAFRHMVVHSRRSPKR